MGHEPSDVVAMPTKHVFHKPPMSLVLAGDRRGYVFEYKNLWQKVYGDLAGSDE
jgi:hypothetical protein